VDLQSESHGKFVWFVICPVQQNDVWCGELVLLLSVWTVEEFEFERGLEIENIVPLMTL